MPRIFDNIDGFLTTAMTSTLNLANHAGIPASKDLAARIGLTNEALEDEE